MGEPIIVTEIIDVQPADRDGNQLYDEGDAPYTMIKCNTNLGLYTLLLPRGEDNCKNTYLLADAIRD